MSNVMEYAMSLYLMHNCRGGFKNILKGFPLYSCDDLGRCDSTNSRLMVVWLCLCKLAVDFLYSGLAVRRLGSDWTLPNGCWLCTALHIVAVAPTVDKFCAALLGGSRFYWGHWWLLVKERINRKQMIFDICCRITVLLSRWYLNVFHTWRIWYLIFVVV